MPGVRGQGSGVRNKALAPAARSPEKPGIRPRRNTESVSCLPSQTVLVKLLQQARRAAQQAYAPYSLFPVGAAVLLTDGQTVFGGCNVENAAYGLSICAERVALTHAIACGRRDFQAIAVISLLKGANPCYPCGPCRQFIAEFGLDIWVVMDDGKGHPLAYSIGELLPKAFQLRRGSGPVQTD